MLTKEASSYNELSLFNQVDQEFSQTIYVLTKLDVRLPVDKAKNQSLSTNSGQQTTSSQQQSRSTSGYLFSTN
jgi:hypothetical protein